MTDHRSTILLVDDEPTVLRALTRALRAGGFNPIPVADADRARELMDLVPIDAIVTDLTLQTRRGDRFAAAATRSRRDLPVVVVTGQNDLTTITAMLDGALPRAVLPKPIDGAALVSTLSTILRAVARQDDDVQITRELAQSMAHALSLRDVETEAHARRVALWARQLATVLGLSEPDVFWVEIGAFLHDIGKIGVPDAILKKPSALDDAEWKIMREHSRLGAQLIDPIHRLRPARDIVLHHHESWCGRGYPSGLVGEAIPLGARIFSPVDAYDAMTSDRPYRAGMSHDEAMSQLSQGAGTQFDPRIVEVLLAIDEREWRSVRDAIESAPPPSLAAPRLASPVPEARP